MAPRYQGSGIHYLRKIKYFLLSHSEISSQENSVRYSTTSISKEEIKSSKSCAEKENIWQPWNIETDGRHFRIIPGVIRHTSQPYTPLALYKHYSKLK